MAARKISIIVCTHNRAEMLPGLIHQLRAQDYPADSFEIIVVDNNSTDNTFQTLEQLAGEAGTPIQYVAENRVGITLVRNRGAEAARYPYLAYLDDDCNVNPDWLKHLVSGFDLHQNVVAVGGQIELQWRAPKPNWLGADLNQWFAANSYLGAESRLLSQRENIIEGNMALNKQAYLAAGGFLGMEQFGSQNMAAGEVLYLLQQLRRQGGEVAFIPQAVALHNVYPGNQQRMIRRAYWQGVSDGIMNYLIYRYSWFSTAGRFIFDAAAFVALIGFSIFSFIKADQAKSMFHLLRAIRRMGLVLSELHLAGDWVRVRSWISTNQYA